MLTTSSGLLTEAFTWKTKGFSCTFLSWQQHLNMLKQECLWVTARHGWRTTHQNMSILFHILMNHERKFPGRLHKVELPNKSFQCGHTWIDNKEVLRSFLKKSEHLYIGRTSNKCGKPPKIPFSKRTVLFKDVRDGARAQQCIWAGFIWNRLQINRETSRHMTRSSGLRTSKLRRPRGWRISKVARVLSHYYRIVTGIIIWWIDTDSERCWTIRPPGLASPHNFYRL